MMGGDTNGNKRREYMSRAELITEIERVEAEVERLAAELEKAERERRKWAGSTDFKR